jgi:hypothetical protein
MDAHQPPALPALSMPRIVPRLALPLLIVFMSTTAHRASIPPVVRYGLLGGVCLEFVMGDIFGFATNGVTAATQRDCADSQ